jgi:hypothetical protein
MAKTLSATGKRKVNLVNDKQFSPIKSADVNKSSIAADQAFQNIILEPTLARADEIIAMQRVLGNRAVNTLLNRPLSKQAARQTKIIVNAAKDEYEQEADRVAAQVLQMPTLQQQEPARHLSHSVQKMPKIQRTGIGSYVVDEKFSEQLNANKGQGEPLQPKLRNDFEAKFGCNFSGVRIHTGAHADALSCSIHARAFTTGSDIYFRQGEYQPKTTMGQRIIAHELTHVLQQGCSEKRQPVIQCLYLNELQPLPLPTEFLKAAIEAYQQSQSLLDGFNQLTEILSELQSFNPDERLVLAELETEVKNERNLLGKLYQNGTIIQSCLLGSIKDRYQELSKISDLADYIPIEDIQGSFALDLVLELYEHLPRLNESLYQLAHLQGNTEPWAVSAYTTQLAKFQQVIMPAFAAIQMPIYLPDSELSKKPENTEPLENVAVSDNQPDGAKIESEGSAGNKSLATNALITTKTPSEEVSDPELAEEEEEQHIPVAAAANDFPDDSQGKPIQKIGNDSPRESSTLSNEVAFNYELTDEILTSPSLNFFEGTNYSAEFSGEQPMSSPNGTVIDVSKTPLNPLGNSSVTPLQPSSTLLEKQPKVARLPAFKSDIDKARRYESRANNSPLTGDVIRYGNPQNRALPFNFSVANAYFAAMHFQKGGDDRRSMFWSRKVLALAPASAYADQARAYLYSKENAEQTGNPTTSGNLPQQTKDRQAMKSRAAQQEEPSEAVTSLHKHFFAAQDTSTIKPEERTNNKSDTAFVLDSTLFADYSDKQTGSLINKPSQTSLTPTPELFTNASKSSDISWHIDTNPLFSHPNLLGLEFFDGRNSDNVPAFETTDLKNTTSTQSTGLSLVKKTPFLATQANIPNPAPAPQQAAASSPLPRVLPPGSITGEHGLTVSPDMIAAIRQDILSTGLNSKWADQHEARVLAAALGAKIIIHNPNTASSENGTGNNIYELYYNGQDHYDANIPDRSSPLGYRKIKIPGDGDCFYNGIVTIARESKNTTYSIIGLRQLVHDNLTDQDIADIALPLIEDFKSGLTNPSRLDGIGIRFKTLMRNRQQSGILHYIDT